MWYQLYTYIIEFRRVSLFCMVSLLASYAINSVYCSLFMIIDIEQYFTHGWPGGLCNNPGPLYEGPIPYETHPGKNTLRNAFRFLCRRCYRPINNHSIMATTKYQILPSNEFTKSTLTINTDYVDLWKVKLVQIIWINWRTKC